MVLSSSWSLLSTDTAAALRVFERKVVDKPETIDALKDNIRKAIGEIQLLTIDNVHKNWIDRVGYCMANRGSRLNEIIFYY